jgi:hypothetical protein
MSLWMIIFGVGLVILLFWLVLWIILSPREYSNVDLLDSDSDEGNEFPEALHETCNTRCGNGRVCESGVCKQEVNQPCSQDVDCAYGNSCIGWICGGRASDSIEQEASSDSDSDTISEMEPEAELTSRRITFIDQP